MSNVTNQDFADFIVNQLIDSAPITCKKMFGEYALYYEQKVVALICDNQLFIKPTEAGKAFIGDIFEASPYPGTKPYFLIDDKLEDSDWLKELILITYNNLPEPKPKKRRKV